MDGCLFLDILAPVGYRNAPISEGIVIMSVITRLVKNNGMKYCLLVEMILCGFHGVGGFGRTAPL